MDLTEVLLKSSLLNALSTTAVDRITPVPGLTIKATLRSAVPFVFDEENIKFARIKVSFYIWKLLRRKPTADIISPEPWYYPSEEFLKFSS
jgi:hypothetical protein